MAQSLRRQHDNRAVAAGRARPDGRSLCAAAVSGSAAASLVCMRALSLQGGGGGEGFPSWVVGCCVFWVLGDESAAGNSQCVASNYIQADLYQVLNTIAMTNSWLALESPIAEPVRLEGPDDFDHPDAVSILEFGDFVPRRRVLRPGRVRHPCLLCQPNPTRRHCRPARGGGTRRPCGKSRRLPCCTSSAAAVAVAAAASGECELQ